MTVISLSGSNHFFLQQELHKLVADFVHKNGELALEKIDGEEAEFERITEGIQSLPFLANKKMVVLRSPGAQKQFTEQIEELLQSVPDTTQVIIVEPKLDKRLVYYKVLKSKTDFREFVELDGPNLSKWLVQEAQNSSGKLSPSDANYLVERVGASQQLLSNELEKLISYNPVVSKDSIDLLTEPTPSGTIFNLLDAAFRGDAKKAATIYLQQRAQKVDPSAILSMLVWQLHILAIVKTAKGRSVGDIVKDAKLKPFVVQKSLEIAKKISFARLKELINELTKLDLKIKSSKIDADQALQNYLLELGR